MIKDEFESLKTLFHAAAEGKPVNISAVFQQSLRFFEELKGQLASGSTEDKQEAIDLMRQMYEQMIGDTKKIVEKSGLSEEQLAAFAENPANFSKEEWKAIQASKEQIQEVGENLSKASQSLGGGISSIKPPVTPKGSKDKLSGKKSNWMRS